MNKIPRSFHQRIVALVVVGVMTTVCSKSDVRKSDSGAPSTAKTREIAGVQPCDLNGPKAKRCKGMMDSEPTTWKEIKDARDDANLQDGDENGRAPHMAHQNVLLQYARTKINADARAIYLQNLPIGKWVLMGAMRIKELAPPESIYTLGDNVPSGDDDLRHGFFVVHRPDATYPKPATNGTDMLYGEWRVYAPKDTFDASGNKARLAVVVRKGVIRKCAEDSPGSNADKAQAKFYKCAGAHFAMNTASVWHVSFDSVSAVIHAIASKANSNRVSFQVQTEGELCKLDTNACKKDKNAFNTKSPSIFVDFGGLTADQKKVLLNGLLTYDVEPATDPYWFSCGPGCCTAGDFS